MIDAHHHFWQIGRHDCTWPTADLTQIYRDFLPDDFTSVAQAAGITGSVLVQSQESDSDTDFLLQLASECELVKAVVGWVDLSSPSAVARIKHLTQYPKLRGLRPMLQGLDDSWILNPSLEPAIAEMKAANLSLDALVHVRQLPYLRIFAKRHPTLAIVIDHAAKPNIAQHEFKLWSNELAAMAELPQVYCKLSGLLTEASAEQGADELRAYVTLVMKLFGAQRLMWGSDWPVLKLAPNSNYAGYAEWLTLAKDLLTDASRAEREAILGVTAKCFYRF